jgi:hypothetical protein
MEVPLVTLPAHVQVANLVARYAETMDLGDFDAVAGLFADGVVTSEGSDRSFSGRDAVREPAHLHRSDRIPGTPSPDRP